MNPDWPNKRSHKFVVVWQIGDNWKLNADWLHCIEVRICRLRPYVRLSMRPFACRCRCCLCCAQFRCVACTLTVWCIRTYTVHRGRLCKSRPLWPALIGHRVPRGQPTAIRKIQTAMTNITLWLPYVFTRFVLFFKDCDSSSGISNMRHTYGTITICLKMNTSSFKNINGLPAKFLGHWVWRSQLNYNKIQFKPFLDDWITWTPSFNNQ